MAEHQAVTVEWVPADLRCLVWRKAAGAVGEVGRLIVIGHDVANLAEGWGGPSDPANLYTAQEVVDAVGAELEAVRAERVLRPEETDEGLFHAVDNIVVAVRR